MQGSVPLLGGRVDLGAEQREDAGCIAIATQAPGADTAFDAPLPPKALVKATPASLEGKWYKVLGYNPKYDTYPCQTNTFAKAPDGGLVNDILFRVPKPDGSGSWQNNFVESMANSRGPEGKASMTVEGKMFGLTFHEQWYVLGRGASCHLHVLRCRSEGRPLRPLGRRRGPLCDRLREIGRRDVRRGRSLSAEH